MASPSRSSRSDCWRSSVRASPSSWRLEDDHLKAADLANRAARRGVALSTPDALIAAQALNRRARLFTTDGDFPKVAAFAGLKLF